MNRRAIHIFAFLLVTLSACAPLRAAFNLFPASTKPAAATQTAVEVSTTAPVPTSALPASAPVAASTTFASTTTASTSPSTTPATTQPNFVRDVDLTTTTFVDVHLHDVTIEPAARAVMDANHTGLNIDNSHEPPLVLQERRDLNITHRPLVLAWMDLADAFDVLVSRNPLTGNLNFAAPQPVSTTEPAAPRPAPERWSNEPVTISGPFAVFARSITITHSADPLPIGQDTGTDVSPKIENMIVRLAFCNEPRIAIIDHASPVVEHCTDDRGNTIERMPPARGAPSTPIGPRDLLGIDLTFKIPSSGATRLAHLSGYLPVTVVSRQAPVAFPSPLQGSWRTLRLPGFRAAVGGFADLPNGEEEAQIVVYRDNADLSTWTSRLLMLQRVHLPEILDSDGHALRTTGLLRAADSAANFGANVGANAASNVAADAGAARATFRLHCRRRDTEGNTIADLPARWKWTIPLQSQHQSIPFDFANLPLPSN